MINEAGMIDRVASKGDSIQSSVGSMGSVIHHLNNLISKIDGSDRTAPPVGQEEVPPSLVHVLNTTPETLSSMESEMHSLIDQLESLLF